MSRVDDLSHHRSIRWFALASLTYLVGSGAGAAAHARIDPLPQLDTWRGAADGVHVVDGSYVMNAGDLHINITNWGLIGSRYSWVTTYSDAPSAQWPGGTGWEYLWGAGLWVGGVALGEQLVTTGQFDTELRPLDRLEDTIYEAANGLVLRPPGNAAARGRRLPEAGADDDEDGRIDEEILNGYDDDEDGRVDEDFGQIGNQMMVCTMYDNTRLAQEIWPDHVPLNLKVVMSSYAWEGDDVNDFVGFEFSITNIGVVDITNVYMGFFADCDIGRRGNDDAAEDDLAGYWEGLIRASDGSFVPVSVGYMYDWAEGDRAPGYFGILFLGAPGSSLSRIRSFQTFTGRTPFEQGGDPNNDEERYSLLSSDEYDPSVQPGRESDFRFLISAGPVTALEPQRTVTFQSAMVVGEGLEGLLRNCAEAVRTYDGSYWDLDENPDSGIGGRESFTCLEWWPINPQTHRSTLYERVADFMDLSCVNQDVPLDFIQDEDLETYGPDLHCLWVNFDNCEECDRRAPDLCTRDNGYFETYWDCNNTSIPCEARQGCTGICGAESPIHWLVGMAPPSPGMRLWAANNAVHVYWDDISEMTKDVRLNVVDFESYRIWRADNWDRPFGSSLDNGPASNLWRLLAEYDLVNTYLQERVLQDGTVVRDTLPLGYNTGLDAIAYRPTCLDDPRFVGLAEAMQAVVKGDSTGRWSRRPALRDGFGEPIPGLEELLPWEGFPAQLDTFFAVTERPEDPVHGIVGKRTTHFYEYVDRTVHNGFLLFYAVTATDHTLDFRFGEPLPNGGGLGGDPSSSFADAVPGFQAQTLEERNRKGANIFVYPNPATRAALEDFQPLHPNSEDPTGLRIMFANLPRARNKISIFTLDGDLVAELPHDGRQGDGQMPWNLVTRNGQQVTSGIYLYAVQSEDKRFEDFLGKFVIIR
jgi:hypothetical protein